MYANSFHLVLFLAVTELGHAVGVSAQSGAPARMSPVVVGETAPLATPRYRLQFDAVEHGGAVRGLRVVRIHTGSPCLKMTRMDAPERHGALEVGDIVTAVDATPTPNVATFYDAMDQSGGNEVTVKVWDVRTRQEISWIVRPVRLANGSKPQSNSHSNSHAERDARGIAHVRLIGLTDDPAIGKSIGVSLFHLKNQFAAQIPAARLDLKVLSAGDCDDEAVNAEIDSLCTQSRPVDSLLVYYLGHGAYDAQAANEDPCNGHFLETQGRPLIRSELYARLLKAPARFHGLISDACNVRGESTAYMAPFQIQEKWETSTERKPSNLEQLLLYHRGELNVNSSSRDEYGWATKAKGLFFTICFVQAIAAESEWRSLVDSTGKRANSLFKMEQAFYRLRPPTVGGATPDDIRSWTRMQEQRQMVPAIYRMATQKDAYIEPRPPLKRTRPILVLTPDA